MKTLANNTKRNNLNDCKKTFRVKTETFGTFTGFKSRSAAVKFANAHKATYNEIAEVVE